MLRLRQILDQLDFKALALVLEQSNGVAPLHRLAGEGGVAGDDLAHPRLDPLEVLRGEGLVPVEVVVEAVLDRRADGDLGAGEKVLHRLGEHMRGVVPDQFKRFRVLAGDEADGGVAVEHGGEVGELAVHAHGDGGLGEAGADGGRHLRARDRTVEAAHGSVGQGDGGHGRPSSIAC